MKTYLKARELRDFLREHGIRLGVNTLYQMARDRKVKVTPIGGSLYFHLDSVEAYFDLLAIPAKRQFFKSHRNHRAQDTGRAM
jgi:hypothetical protein